MKNIDNKIIETNNNINNIDQKAVYDCKEINKIKNNYNNNQIEYSKFITDLNYLKDHIDKKTNFLNIIEDNKR